MDLIDQLLRTNMTCKADMRKITFRLEEDIKRKLKIASEQQSRTVSNMIKHLIVEYCRNNGIE